MPSPPRSSVPSLVLAASAFVIVTTEFLIVGLLPALARDLNVKVSSAGLLVTLFAFIVALAGPPLTALLSHVPRRRLFVTLLMLFAFANAMSAIAPNIWLLGAARAIAALALPVFWGTASDTASRLAGPERAGRAVALVYLGIAGATLFGIPLGTLVSSVLGWRSAFGLLAALSLAMAGSIRWLLPTIREDARTSLRQQVRVLGDASFLPHILLSALVFTAMFTAYTYLADTLEKVAMVPAEHVGWWLMGFGAVGLLGNWAGGRLVERNALGSTAGFLVILAIAMTATVPMSTSHVLLAIVLVIWGVAYTALFPISQVRVMNAAAHSRAFAGSLNISAANVGIGCGALIGGSIIDGFGLRSVGGVAAGIAVAAAALAFWILGSQSERSPAVS